MKKHGLIRLVIAGAMLTLSACEDEEAHEGQVVLTEEGIQLVAKHRKACDEGIASSCHELGMISLVQEDSDRVKEREYFRKACDGGIAQACGILGMMWNDGVGGEKDTGKANRLRQRACELGESKFCGEAKR